MSQISQVEIANNRRLQPEDIRTVIYRRTSSSTSSRRTLLVWGGLSSVWLLLIAIVVYSSWFGKDPSKLNLRQLSDANKLNINTQASSSPIITISSSQSSPRQIRVQGAAFGGSIKEKLYAKLIVVSPIDACTKIQNIPHITGEWVALVKRGTCNFDTKALLASSAGASGVLIYSNKNDDVLNERFCGDPNNKMVLIPVAIMDKRDGELIAGEIVAGFKKNPVQEFFVSILAYHPGSTCFPMGPISDLAVVWQGVLFGVLLGSSILCFLQRLNKIRRDRQRRLELQNNNNEVGSHVPQHLTPEQVEAIESCLYYPENPSVSLVTSENDVTSNNEFLKNNSGLRSVYSDCSNCSICIDEFIPGSRVSQLPCNHIFHIECIGKWLSSHGSSCPLCKKNVLPDNSDEVVNEEGEDNERNRDPNPTFTITPFNTPTNDTEVAAEVNNVENNSIEVNNETEEHIVPLLSHVSNNKVDEIESSPSLPTLKDDISTSLLDK